MEKSLVSVVAGGLHTCGLTSDGEAWCWGTRGAGALGDGSGEFSSSYVPSAVAGGMRFVSLTAGEQHTCGLVESGNAYCWGSNSAGQLGRPDVDGNASEPLPVSGGVQFASLSAGHAHTCGIATSGALLCWGANGSGQVGDGSTDNFRSQPTAVSSSESYLAVSAADWHTCAVTGAGSMRCWGDNSYGQLGTGGSQGSSTPVAPLLPPSIRGAAARMRHSCSVDATGVARCWGWNSFGQLGDGTQDQRTEPVEVTGQRFITP